MSLPGTTCGWEPPPATITLADGRATAPDGETIRVSPDDAIFKDLNGDGVQDVVLTAVCGDGQNEYDSSVVVALTGDDPYLLDGQQVLASIGIPAPAGTLYWGRLGDGEGERIVINWSIFDEESEGSFPTLAGTSAGTVGTDGFDNASTALADYNAGTLVTRGPDVPDGPPAPAACVSDELYYLITSRRDEVVLYQQKLADLGYYDGAIDGTFGYDTSDAAYAEIEDNGVGIEDGEFVEIFPDEGAVLMPAFERLGIACADN